MIIDKSHFIKGILLIEGITTGETLLVDKAKNEHLTDFIDTYESEYLTELLGCDLSEEYIAYLSEESEPIEKWDNLTAQLKAFKVSPIACYVYYWFVRNNQTQATPIGVTKADSDNIVSTPNMKLVQAWNNGVRSNIRLVRWLSDNEYEYNCSRNLLTPINIFGV